MIKKDLKKFLASLGVAGLISAGGISVPGAYATGSGWGAQPSAGSTEETVKSPAGSGWGGSTDSVGDAAKKDGEDSVEDAKEEAADTATDSVNETADEIKKKAGSGWGGEKK